MLDIKEKLDNHEAHLIRMEDRLSRMEDTSMQFMRDELKVPMVLLLHNVAEFLKSTRDSPSTKDNGGPPQANNGHVLANHLERMSQEFITLKEETLQGFNEERQQLLEEKRMFYRLLYDAIAEVQLKVDNMKDIENIMSESHEHIKEYVKEYAENTSENLSKIKTDIVRSARNSTVVMTNEIAASIVGVTLVTSETNNRTILMHTVLQKLKDDIDTFKDDLSETKAQAVLTRNGMKSVFENVIRGYEDKLATFMTAETAKLGTLIKDEILILMGKMETLSKVEHGSSSSSSYVEDDVTTNISSTRGMSGGDSQIQGDDVIKLALTTSMSYL